MARQAGVPAYGITSGTELQMLQWNDISMASYPLFTADDSDIKMLARGNPAVVMILGGKVAWKRTLRSIPPAAVTNDRDVHISPDQIDRQMGQPFSLSSILKSMFIALLALLLLNRTHRFVWWLRKCFRKPPSKEN